MDSICPGCGFASPEPSDACTTVGATEACWKRYLDVAAHEAEHLVELGRFHQLMVDAYGAQHPDAPSPLIRLTYSLVGLHLSLDLGWSGIDVRTAHMQMGKPAAWWPRFDRPRRLGAITVDDVALGAESEGPAGHAHEIERWAAEVWHAWGQQHDRVAQLTSKLRLRRPN